uniref:Sortilin_C domain-containing protein n=1 Tax=Macrostomum lignano TaxID=282301 RepID=A0A1I8F8W4_9PLAT
LHFPFSPRAGIRIPDPSHASQPLFVAVHLPAASLVATQCVHEGRMVPNGGLLPNPSGDACFDRVCRCESWDRCRFELERKSVLAKVNEQRQAEADSQQGSALVRTLECKCVEDLEGRRAVWMPTAASASPASASPWRHRAASRSFCECNANGHYVNCASQDDLRDDDGCQGHEAGARVALGAAYSAPAAERPAALECVCTKSDQETACVRLE